MLSIKDLKFTQLGLRQYDQLDQMVSFVKSGGIYTQAELDKFTGIQSTNLIGISRFEDGELYVHDGHHRVVSILLSGVRDYLYPEEYIITDYTYFQYNRPNFKNNWYTPFDPKTQLRIADFFKYREKIKNLTAIDEKKAIDYIAETREEYLVKKKDYDITWHDFHIERKDV